MFHGTDNKRELRRRWDLPILSAASQRVGRRLDYFGLPGPDIEDLIDWSGVLGFRTAVQHVRKGRHSLDDLSAVTAMVRNAGRYKRDDGAKLSAFMEVLRGEAEAVILTGADLDGKRPHHSYGHSDPRFCYDLYNLDFTGGWYANDTRRARRSDMLSALFHRQQGHDFVLLMTLNIRNTVDEYATEYLTGLADRSSDGLKETLLWHANRGRGELTAKMSVLYPLVVQDLGGAAGFKIKSYPTVTYKGSGANRMMHFVFEAEYQASPFRVFADQAAQDLVDYPLLEVDGGAFSISSLRPHEGLILEASSDFDFLSQDVRAEILASTAALQKASH